MLFRAVGTAVLGRGHAGQAVRQAGGVGRPVAEPVKVVAARGKPAVVEDKRLHAVVLARPFASGQTPPLYIFPQNRKTERVIFYEK